MLPELYCEYMFSKHKSPECGEGYCLHLHLELHLHSSTPHLHPRGPRSRGVKLLNNLLALERPDLKFLMSMNATEICHVYDIRAASLKKCEKYSLVW